MNKLSCLAICTLISASATAQKPVLNIGGKESTEVYLQSLDIQVDVTGNISSTKFTMTFKNRTGRILEGELLFPLPDGVTVSHYALDINGKMREAVPVEKAKATQVFEEIEQRRVDPGLLERVEGNNFRTRIYPIPANGSRTISIGYEQELPVTDGLLRYRLPMDYKERIDKFSLKSTVWQSKDKPRMDDRFSNELQFDEQGTNYVASFTRNDYQPTRSLAFSLPVPLNTPQVFMQPASGSYYFMASCRPDAGTRKKEWSNQLGIIWDVSLSGMQRDTERELDLLDAVFEEKGNFTVTLYLLNNKFNNAGTFQVQNGKWDDLRRFLKSVNYDGGTDYSTIELYNSPAKEVLLFSEGLSTLSDADFIVPLSSRRMMMSPDLRKSNIGRPIHCLVSSSRADYSALKWIAAQTNGKFINLNALSQPEARNELMNETLHFIGIEKKGSIREVYPSVSTPVYGNFSIAGIMDDNQAEVTLLFGYGSKVEKKITVSLQSGDAAQQSFVHRIWAQKKINELDMCYEKNKEELTDLGQQFGIVTRNTSLIVLETLQDYITYGIVPPEELQADYFRWKKGQDDERLRQAQSLLANALSAAEDLKQWWNTDFTPPKNKYPQPDKKSRAEVPANVPAPLERAVQLDLQIVSDEIVVSSMESEESAPMVNESSSRVTISGMGDRMRVAEKATKTKSAAPSAPGQQQPVIKLTPIKQDNAYSKQLTGKADADYIKYLEIRPEYINTPTFYFDMADWFFKLNDKEKAIRILTSIADLELENASLFRLLGYRLKEYGEYEMEAYICKKVIQWRPMEPQSYRDYALSLADAGRYQEALNSLYSVLTQSYARNIGARSAGIEEVIVTELNQLVASNKLNTPDMDNQLIQAMPVDIRVVINWNMNSTDIDLHVKDPNGETCYYGHKRTTIGGRISRDITQGYGPEQFMLKNAGKGKYEVFVNYFGDSQVKAEGPSTIMVEIFTNYSDKSQKRQVVCLQMSKETKAQNGLIKVAEFYF